MSVVFFGHLGQQSLTSGDLLLQVVWLPNLFNVSTEFSWHLLVVLHMNMIGNCIGVHHVLQMTKGQHGLYDGLPEFLYPG